MNSTTTSSSDATTLTPNQILGYDLIDSRSSKVGAVDGVWVNPTSNQLQFVGVKTTPLVGKTHVVPADQAQVDGGNQTITVPYTEDAIKNAPTFDTNATMMQTDENTIQSYYQQAQSQEQQSGPGSTVIGGAIPAVANTDAGQPGKYPVDNTIYNLYTLISQKLQGVEAYDTYIRDAKGDQGLGDLLRQLRQQDAQSVQQLQQYLVQRLTGQTSTS